MYVSFLGAHFTSRQGFPWILGKNQREILRKAFIERLEANRFKNCGGLANKKHFMAF